ncbi:IS5 family transposase, partial [Burkholderia pseudomallei]|uniref:IS5 family transposase n=1 Tax=Burkholderia pseudomallei TaxID=28450 RepID=UPI004043E534
PDILPGPNPTDRARPGSKHHLATDANGTPIAAILTGANRNDVTQLIPLIEAIVPIKGVRGRPLSRPKRVYADRGYDHDKYRRILHERGIPTSIARRGQPHGSGLGKVRWVVERTHAWMHHFRRLRIRFERRADIHEAFLKLGCSMICWNILQRTQQPL